MKKISMLILALVLALGALGVGYAAWTDDVTITGVVTTGTVDLTVEAYSCTYVWKVGEEARDADDMVVIYTCTGTPPLYAIDAFPNDGANPADIDPVAYGKASFDGEDAVYVDIFNVFPLNTDDQIKADFLLHYTGSVPVRVELADLRVTSGNLYAQDLIIEAWVSNAAGDELDLIGGVEDLLCYQLHYSNRIKINVIMLAHQDFQDVDSGKSGTIAGKIKVTQWNEVVCPPAPVNPECAAEVCGTFTTCNAGGNCVDDGVCAAVAEGGGTCVYGPSFCSDLASCPGGTVDCGFGELCVVDTCCGGPVCVPGPYDFCYPAGNGGSVPEAGTSGSGPSIGQ